MIPPSGCLIERVKIQHIIHRLLAAVFAVAMIGSFLPERGSAVLLFVDGDDLLSQCTRYPGQCVGYLQGIADAMALSQVEGESLDGWRACIEAGVNVEQIRDVTARGIGKLTSAEM